MEERLCEHRDRDGRRQLYRYNMYGSPTLHENPAERLRESWEYDAMGRLITATGGGMQYRYTYYDNGRLKEKQASGRTLLAYAYDLSGNVVSRRDLTGKETCYGYDRCGRLKSVTDNGRVLAAYTYHGDGRVELRTIADTIRTDFRYDADKNLTHMKTVDMTAQGRKLVWEEYPAYDHNGNMVEKRNLEGTTRYAYDVNNQLVEVSYPGTRGLLLEKFGYDRAGNRLTRERHTADSIIMETYCHDNCNRIKELNRRTYEPDGVTQKLKKSPAVSNNPDAVASYIGETGYYGYDRSGNLLSDGNATYTYDSFGRTAEVRMANGDSQINRYDAEGLRAEMEENGQLVKFLFNEEKEAIAEETDDGLIRYIRGLGIISSDSESARTYYHYVSDNQGSVRLILTDTVNDRRIRNYYCYDAFGESVISHEDIHNRFRFNGEQYDPVTSQYYLRARFYNPVIGRFTQEDTYYGDGLNLYEYCRNNPVLYRDPSGHDAVNQGNLYRDKRHRRIEAEKKLAEAARGNRAKSILIGKDGDVPVYQSQKQLIDSIIGAGAKYVGNTRNGDGKIYHMNTPNGPVEIRIMQQKPGQTNPYLDNRTIIVEQGSVGKGTGVYTYGNGAKITGSVSKEKRKEIGHTHGQTP